MQILTFDEWYIESHLWKPKHEEHRKNFEAWCAELYCDYLSELKECFDSDYWDYYSKNDPDLKRILEIEKAHFERFPDAKISPS